MYDIFYASILNSILCIYSFLILKEKNGFPILVLWKYPEIARTPLSSASSRAMCYDLHHLIFMDHVCLCWAVAILFPCFTSQCHPLAAGQRESFLILVACTVCHLESMLKFLKYLIFNWNCLVGWGCFVSSFKRTIIWSSKCGSLHQSWSATYNW